MAFFGLTGLGPQNSFQANLRRSVDISLFDEADIRAAFVKCDTTQSGSLNKDDVSKVVTALYKGFPPAHEITALSGSLNRLEGDSFTLQDFSSAIQDYLG